jgi:hypothetical protein
MKTNIHFWSYLAHFFLEWEMFRTKVVEKIKTHILCSVTFFRKTCRLWENVETNYCKSGQATDDNMAHAHCMLHTLGYKNTEYVILIAFPQQLLLHERALMLHYTYITSHVSSWTRGNIKCVFVCELFLVVQLSKSFNCWHSLHSLSDQKLKEMALPSEVIPTKKTHNFQTAVSMQCFNVTDALKPEFDENYFYSFSSYGAVNTICIHYENHVNHA